MMESANIEYEALDADITETTETGVFAFPASLSQTRFWELDQLRPGNPAYNVAVRFRLEGKLDVPRLEQAFTEIVRRHEVLRATFQVADGQLAQFIAPSVNIKVPVADLRELADAAREAEIERLSIEEAQRSFDTSVGPLFRASLIQLADAQHILLVTVHHLVSDGWSIGLITNDVGAIYEALSEGREALLPELPIQYTDFAVWQKEWLQDSSLNQQLSYWMRQLQQLTQLNIPTDRVRPANQTFNGAIVSTVLPRDLTDAVQHYSTRSGGTFFVTVLSGFKLLLHLYSKQTDISIGTQVAGRNRVELENLIGLFINTVILRTDLSGDPSFRELVDRVREMAFQSVANQDAPFEQVLAALAPKPDPSRNPLFQVNFICQRDFVKPLQFSGLTLTAIPSKSQGALYDLNVFLVERPDGWRLSCEYNTDLFEQTTAEKILKDYRALLEQVIQNPERRISEYALLTSSAEDPGEQISAQVALPSSCRAPDDPQSDAYVLPTSLCQRRFWLLDQLMPCNPAFNMPAALRLKGSLDIEALQASVNHLIRRHEALRTAFEARDGGPFQLVASDLKIKIQLQSLEHLAEGSRETEAMQLLEEYARLPFDLANPPLLRVNLLRLAADHHFLLLTMPHIICDGWSHGILMKELWSLYESHLRGAPRELPDVRIQYGDFALWESQWLESDAAQESLTYWKNRLGGKLPVLNVPMDRPIVFGKCPRGGIETILFPADLTAALKNLCKREHATMFVLCLAAFKTLLHHYTGQEDVLVGSPVANRTPETEGSVGAFSNPVCLRTNLSGNPSFRQLLQRVRAASFEALDHKDLPIERILPEITAPSLDGRSSVFQFYFFYQVAFLQPMESSHLVSSPLPTLSPGAWFEWQLGIIERPEGVRAQLQYNADLYDASTIARVLSHLHALLQAVVAAPEQTIQQIQVLTDDERLRLADWRKAHPEHSNQRDCGKNYIAPRNAVERQLAGIWEETLKMEPIGIKTSFFDIGGHSLQLAELLTKIHSSMGKRLPLASLFGAPTIEQMALLVEGKTPNPSELSCDTEPLLR
jgi:non-ribosomal peptide synthetase component F